MKKTLKSSVNHDKGRSLSLAAFMSVAFLLSTGCAPTRTATPNASQPTDSERTRVAIAPSPTASPVPAGHLVPISALPEGVKKLAFLNAEWQKTHGNAQPGKFFAVDRGDRKGVDLEKIKVPTVSGLGTDVEPQNLSGSQIKINPDADVEFEFFDIKTRKAFKYVVKRGELTKISQAVAPGAQERRIGDKKPSREERAQEDQVTKGWSNATDTRTRRAIADGYSDKNSVYQNFADYGGGTATVLYASASHMVAITAAHVIYQDDGSFSTSKISPRMDNGSTSPTWGSWTAYKFGYFPAFLDNNCAAIFTFSSCAKYDIALVFATPDSNVNGYPNGLGWGYRSQSFLDSHTKYSRGYPGCGSGYGPSPCTENTLYGDTSFSVGSFGDTDSDGWPRTLYHSSDTSPGQSGSSLYYYRDGNPYVFGVGSGQTCQEDCNSSRPNFARAHNEVWYDFINSVVP